MKTLVLAVTAFVLGIPAYAQYSAKSLTRKIVPPAPQPAQPARPVPGYAAPAQPATPPRELTPAEAAKAQVKKDKNDVKQFEFYKRRAEEGSDHAQYELGVRYLDGKGVDKNEKLGREWLEKASKQGHKEATTKLGQLGGEPKAAVPATSTSPIASEKK